MSLSNRIWKFIADKLPRKLVYWCAVRVIAHATTGQFSTSLVTELSAMEALYRWEKT